MLFHVMLSITRKSGKVSQGTIINKMDRSLSSPLPYDINIFKYVSDKLYPLESAYIRYSFITSSGKMRMGSSCIPIKTYAELRIGDPVSVYYFRYWPIINEAESEILLKPTDVMICSGILAVIAIAAHILGFRG